MSTILKALRRLEEDRQREDERSLRDRILSQEVSGGESSPGLNRSAGLLAGVGGLALLAAGVMTWWTLAGGSRGAGDGLANETPPVFREHPVAEPEAFAASMGLPAVSAPPPSASTPAAVPEPAASTRLPAMENPRPAADVGKPGVPPPEPSAVAPSPRSAPPAAPPGPDPAPPASSAVAPSPVAVADAAPGIAEDVRLVTRPPKPGVETAAVAGQVARHVAPREAAVARQAQGSEAPAVQTIERSPMPEFVVTRTVWHPDASRRVAMIRQGGRGEPRPFGEGESLGVLEIVEIQPAGVLFRRDGVEIKRRVGR